jgi:hypothetical protein
VKSAERTGTSIAVSWTVIVLRPPRNAPEPRQPRHGWIANLHAPTFSEVTRDTLFEGLEGRTIRLFDRTWNVSVYSISEENGGHWLQLSLAGQPDYTVTVGCALSTGPDRIVRALSGWLARPVKSSTVLHIS